MIKCNDPFFGDSDAVFDFDTVEGFMSDPEILRMIHNMSVNAYLYDEQSDLQDGCKTIEDFRHEYTNRLFDSLEVI